MDLLQLDQELRSNKLRTAYLIVGPERHLAWTSRQQILRAIFPKDLPSPDIFEADQTPIGKILDCLKTPSMFAPRRVVIVNEADTWKKKEWEAIQKFLETKPAGLTLLLFLESGKTETAMLAKVAAVIECKKLYPRQIPAWLNMEAKNMNIPLSREAANFLIDCAGTDLGELSQELQKLVLFVGPQKIINLADVEKMAAPTAKRNLFDLMNAVGKRELKSSIKQLNQILDQGEEPLKVLALMSRHFRILAKAQELTAGGQRTSPGEIARELKVPPFFVNEYMEQGRRFGAGVFKKCFETLYQTDRALKSSRKKPHIILEKLIRTLVISAR